MPRSQARSAGRVKAQAAKGSSQVRHQSNDKQNEFPPLPQLHNKPVDIPMLASPDRSVASTQSLTTKGTYHDKLRAFEASLQSLEYANAAQNKLTAARLDGIETNLQRLDSLDAKLSVVSFAIEKSAATQADFAATQERLESNMAAMKADTATKIEDMGITLLTSMEKQNHVMATNMDEVRAQMQQMSVFMATFTQRLSDQAQAPRSPHKKKQRSYDDLNPPSTHLTSHEEVDDMETDEPSETTAELPNPPDLPRTNLRGTFDQTPAQPATVTPLPSTHPTSLLPDPTLLSTPAPPNPQYNTQMDLAGASGT